MDGILLKRLVRGLGMAVAALAFCAWFLGLAYADWLWFSGPRSPHPETDQVVYVKAFKGVFYATPAQAWWATGDLPLIWLIGVAGALVAYPVRERRPPPEVGRPSQLRARLSMWAALVFFVVFLMFPDHLMALLMTGSLHVPPKPPPGATVVPPGH